MNVNSLSLTRTSAILLGIGVGFIITALRLFSPSYKPLILNSVKDTATLHFSLSPSKEIIPSGCVKIGWQVEGIDQIFLNGRGVIGSGEESLCDLAHTAIFRVHFLDDTSEMYTLSLQATADNLLYWLIMGSGIGVLVLSYTLLRGHPLFLSSITGNLGIWLGLILFGYLVSSHLVNPVMRVPFVDLNQDLETRAATIESRTIFFAEEIVRLTPPDSVIFIPMGIASPSGLHTFAYPRLFLYAGDVRKYMETYVGDPLLSYVGTAFDNAQRYALAPETFEHLYLFVPPTMLEALEATDSGRVIKLGRPERFLWELNGSVSVEGANALVRSLQESGVGATTGDEALPEAFDTP